MRSALSGSQEVPALVSGFPRQNGSEGRMTGLPPEFFTLSDFGERRHQQCDIPSGKVSSSTVLTDC